MNQQGAADSLGPLVVFGCVGRSVGESEASWAVLGNLWGPNGGVYQEQNAFSHSCMLSVGPYMVSKPASHALCCLVVCTVPAQRTTRRGGVFRGFCASGRFAYDLLRSATVRTPCREGFHIHVREVISAGGVDRRSVALTGRRSWSVQLPSQGGRFL